MRRLPQHRNSYQITIKGEIDDDYENLLDKLAEQLAKLFYERLIRNIRSNRFGYQLKESTKKKRKAVGRPGGLPLLDTGAYISQIQLDGAKVYVQEGTTTSGFDFTELANILEYGRRDKGFRGFPVWRDTYKELEKEMIKITEAFIRHNIFRDKKSRITNNL